METLDELDYILDNFVINTEYSYGYPETKGYRGVIFSSSKGSFVVGANVKDFVDAHNAPDWEIDKILKKTISKFIFEPSDLDNSWMCFSETPNSWHGSRYMTHDVSRPSIQFTMV